MDPKKPTNSVYLSPDQDTPTELYRRPSLERDGRPGKRGRASKPKVKSGCITCKARRVKCDETKPQCVRCQKFGRKCDGYLPEQSQARSLSHIQPRAPSLGMYNPSVSVHDTEDESRYFRVFSERTVFAMTGFFDGTPGSTFWTRLVLQESQNLSAVRHAAIALGALTQSLDDAPPPNLKVNIIQSMGQRHHEQAVLQHLKAIQALKQYISSSGSPQLRNALITCLLFICFEVFQGSFVSCIQQTYGGLKMLRSYYGGQDKSRSSTPGQATSGRRKESLRTSQLPTSIQTQLNRQSLTNSAASSHLEDHMEATRNNRPEIGIQAPSPQQITFDTLSVLQDYSMASGTVGPHSPKSYLNAVPSNVPNSNWQWGSQDFLAVHDLGNLARRGSGSTASSPILGSGPPSRSGSFTLPSTPIQATGSQRPIISRGPSPPLLQSDMPIEEVLIQTFIRLDGQGLMFGTIPVLPPLIWDIHRIHHIPIPNSFATFHMAHCCWDFLMDRALQFYRRTLFNRNFSPESSEPPAKIAAELEFYHNQLAAFDAAFKPTMDDAVQIDGTVTNAAAIVISLYQRCVAIMFSVITEESEMVFDDYLTDFKYIVDTCRLLMVTSESTQLPRIPRFTLDVGVLPPLHLTVTKCRDPTVRREALDLLFSNPRQEGMWDGVLSARIGRWVMAWEEEGLPSTPFPSRSYEIPGLSPNEHLNYTLPLQPTSQGWGLGYEIVETADTVADRMVAMGVNEYAASEEGGGLLNSVGLTPTNMHPFTQRTMGTRPRSNTGFVVPEENRVQLTLIDYHIPDRYIKVRCQKSTLRGDGTREERETIIAW